VTVEVEDNGGTWHGPVAGGAGLGMQIVDKRLKNLYGEAFGLSVDSQAQRFTRVTVRLPAEGGPPP
jgi:two-component system LytT family sensor kinase